MDGILNIDKPRGLTSHDVVARVRRVTGERAGHAGTLDPNATGVLLVCLGRATRIAEYLTAGRKIYRAGVRLGTTTDTYDSEGNVLHTRPVDVSEGEIHAALEAFRGRIQQVPPAYSALKKDGQPLYKLARRGIAVERPPRPVEIFDLRVEDCSPPDVALSVTCSPGTYIRSLANDLGEALGCGAHLASLERTASGAFVVDDSLSLDSVEALAEQNALRDRVMALDAALAHFPALQLSAEDAVKVRHGGSLSASRRQPAEAEDLCRAYDENQRFIALLQFDTSPRRWRPHKVFAD